MVMQAVRLPPGTPLVQFAASPQSPSTGFAQLVSQLVAACAGPVEEVVATARVATHIAEMRNLRIIPRSLRPPQCAVVTAPPRPVQRTPTPAGEPVRRARRS